MWSFLIDSRAVLARPRTVLSSTPQRCAALPSLANGCLGCGAVSPLCCAQSAGRDGWDVARPDENGARRCAGYLRALFQMTTHHRKAWSLWPEQTQCWVLFWSLPHTGGVLLMDSYVSYDSRTYRMRLCHGRRPPSVGRAAMGPPTAAHYNRGSSRGTDRNEPSEAET